MYDRYPALRVVYTGSSLLRLYKGLADLSRTKTREQIKDAADGYLALDDIETGSGRTIPLWMFGFLY